MIALTAEEAGQALELGHLAEAVPGVSIDSRSVRPGDLFVALRGERFDGHDFVGAALAAGASGAVVDASAWDARYTGAQRRSPLQSEQSVYRVPDTFAALGALARMVRRKSGAIVIAITGSVGKTSTKDLVGAMAARARRVVTTDANQNNEVGVPLTLLGIESGTEVVVVEMGMRGYGQIAALAGVAEPDVGVVTNVNPVHLEVVGTLEDVAKAKAELICCLAPGGVAVVPFESRLLQPHVAAWAGRVVRFGLDPGSETAEVHGSLWPRDTGGGDLLVLRWPQGKVEVEIPFASRHRLENTLAAAAACYAAGLPLEQCVPGVADVRFTGSRGDAMRLDGICVINDTYNANPAAVQAALDDLVDLAAQKRGRPVAVLGDMLELGQEADRYHREAGAYAADAGVRALWGVGPLSRATVEGYRKARGSRQEPEGRPPITGGHVGSAKDAQQIVAGLRPGDVVLFKGSRSMRLEIMVERVVQEAEAGAWRGASGTGLRSDDAARRSRQ